MSKKAPLIVSPKGTFGYAWVNKPDEGQKYSDGKYKVTMRIAKSVLSEPTEWTVGNDLVEGTYGDFLDWIVEQHVAAGGSRKAKNPIKDGDTETNKNDESRFPGEMYFVAKTKFQPDQVDAKLGPVPAAKGAMSGDVGKLAFKLFEYDDGVALQLAAVQIIEKNATGGGSYANAFGATEGYEAPNEDAGGFTNEDDASDY